jgi:membrane fusion protein (multidrug efflux system)
MEVEPTPRPAVTPIKDLKIPVAPPPLQQPAAIQPRFKGLSKTKLIGGSILLIAALIFITRFAYAFFTTESTDDSFVAAHVHAVGARIIGTVSEVLVEEHQMVKKGQVLARIDKADFTTQVTAAQAAFTQATKDLERWRGQVPWDVNEKLQFNTSTANYTSTKAALEKAQLQLLYTDIVAPEDGKIGKRSVETGMQVLPGQPLFAVVEMKPWVTANFKESQLAHIKIGQPAEIVVDSIPGHVFRGHVESLSPGAGSTFALLPPDNATGNFTKIVQRIPVRVAFDEDSLKGFEDRVAPGMSTEVTILIR